MAGELDDRQKAKLDQQTAMVRALAALPQVDKHDTRFANELALKAPASTMPEVTRIVEHRMGEAVGEDISHDPMARALGGLREGQTLYRQDLGGGLWLYVAFWPWKRGDMVTLKIGLYEAG